MWSVGWLLASWLRGCSHPFASGAVCARQNYSQKLKTMRSIGLLLLGVPLLSQIFGPGSSVFANYVVTTQYTDSNCSIASQQHGEAIDACSTDTNASTIFLSFSTSCLSSSSNTYSLLRTYYESPDCSGVASNSQVHVFEEACEAVSGELGLYSQQSCISSPYPWESSDGLVTV